MRSKLAVFEIEPLLEIHDWEVGYLPTYKWGSYIGVKKPTDFRSPFNYQHFRNPGHPSSLIMATLRSPAKS